MKYALLFSLSGSFTIVQSQYTDRCFCPQIEALLKSDQKLVDKLHELRRQEVQNLPIYWPPSKL